jgi:hypothetical protein
MTLPRPIVNPLDHSRLVETDQAGIVLDRSKAIIGPTADAIVRAQEDCVMWGPVKDTIYWAWQRIGGYILRAHGRDLDLEPLLAKSIPLLEDFMDEVEELWARTYPSDTWPHEVQVRWMMGGRDVTTVARVLVPRGAERFSDCRPCPYERYPLLPGVAFGDAPIAFDAEQMAEVWRDWTRRKLRHHLGAALDRVAESDPNKTLTQIEAAAEHLRAWFEAVDKCEELGIK